MFVSKESSSDIYVTARRNANKLYVGETQHPMVQDIPPEKAAPSRFAIYPAWFGSLLGSLSASRDLTTEPSQLRLDS